MPEFAAPRIKVQDQDYPTVISLEQAARIIGCSRPTMSGILERGAVQGHKDRHRWLINTRSVFEYIGMESAVVFNV